jgi:hypothetical protein
VLSGKNPTYLPFGMVAILVVLFTVLHPSVRRARRAHANGNGNANGSSDGEVVEVPAPVVSSAAQDPLS